MSLGAILVILISSAVMYRRFGPKRSDGKVQWNLAFYKICYHFGRHPLLFFAFIWMAWALFDQMNAPSVASLRSSAILNGDMNGQIATMLTNDSDIGARAFQLGLENRSYLILIGIALEYVVFSIRKSKKPTERVSEARTPEEEKKSA